MPIDSVLSLSTYFSKFKSPSYISTSHPEQDKRLHKVIEELTLSPEYLKIVCDAFVDELQLGLELHSSSDRIEWRPDDWNCKASSFKMLDTCVDKIPTGKEKGSSLAIDFGGTNLRAVLVSLKGNGICEGIQKSYNLKAAGMMKPTTTATTMFEYIAECLRDVKSKGKTLEGHSLDDEILSIGFTFSFPFVQRALTEMELVEWTKGFETGRDTNDPVEGRDAGKLLQQALVSLQVGGNLKAVLNDTVGTLISCCYEVEKKRLGNSREKRQDMQESTLSRRPSTGSIQMIDSSNEVRMCDDDPEVHNIYPCLVGMILGTGANACYVEPNAAKYGYVGLIINTEFGNFSHRSFPLTSVDMEIDSWSTNKGKQLYEKMISGFYIGELVRRFVVKVFQQRTPEKAWTEHSFTGEDAAVIVNDDTSDLSHTKACLKRCWNVTDECDIRTIRQIVNAVLSRSAAFAACALIAMAKKTEKLDEGTTVGIDGSMYTKNPWYKLRLREYIQDILGEKSYLINIEIAHDGSGKGAGILAALQD